MTPVLEVSRTIAKDKGKPSFEGFTNKVKNTNVPEEATEATRIVINSMLLEANAKPDKEEYLLTFFSGIAEKILGHKFTTEVEARYAIEYIMAAGATRQLLRLIQEETRIKTNKVSIIEDLAKQKGMMPNELGEIPRHFIAQDERLGIFLRFKTIEEYLAWESPEIGTARDAAITNYGIMLMTREWYENTRSVINVILGDIQLISGMKKDMFGDVENVVEECFKNPMIKSRIQLFITRRR